MKRFVRYCLVPFKCLGFLFGLVTCAIVMGVDAAEDWLTDNAGLGRAMSNGQ